MTKKVLVLSNNPICNTSSNGNTMMNLLDKLDKEDVLNIYIKGVLNGERFVYQQISDSDVVKSFFGKKTINNKPDTNHLSKDNYKVTRRKTFFKMVLRDYFWSRSKVKKSLLAISRSFKPDLLLLQIGDSTFMINNALYIASQISEKLSFRFV